MQLAGLLFAMALACASCAAACARDVAKPTDNMAAIPGGTFAMGSDAPDANENEKPIHTVTVAGYRLDRTEVTVAAYGECVRSGKCSEPDPFTAERGNYRIFCNWRHPEGRWTHPINCVDFEQARAFCAWVGKRLPSEEEWEYAARAGSEGRKYPWGASEPDKARLNACGEACTKNLVARRFPGVKPLYAASDGWPETAPVGSFPAGASKHGVLDLAGNVWEWTATLYTTYDGSHAEPKRVLRGGSWGGGDARTERTTNRFRLDPSSRAQFLGFRCAK